jgi:hypothetical protein
MRLLFNRLKLLSKHLIILDKTFRKRENYSDKIDHAIYYENLKRFEELAAKEKLKYDHIKAKESDKGIKVEYSFIDEVYSESSRQMKLADAIEFLFFSRGIYYLFQSEKFKEERVCKFLELNLRFVNMLMIYETLTVDNKLRKAFLSNLKPVVRNDVGFSELKNWNDYVGLDKKDKKLKKNAPNIYFDSLLPKTAGGLWHEILVYCFILKYNIGYIFPLLLTQKPISRKHKLSPPDLIVLHNKTYRYYGIEIGNLKERQSGGFMAPSGVPVIPIDTLNARISDRCPSCRKWIGICPKVINDFSNGKDLTPTNEIRCLTECEIYTLKEKLDGVCKYMKFRYKNKNWRYDFADNKHYHYHCCLARNHRIKNKITAINSYKELTIVDSLIRKKNIKAEERNKLTTLQKKLETKYSFIKTHSIFYSELLTLYKMNRGVVESEMEIEKNDDKS